MVSEFPAGLTRQTIETTLELDPAVLSFHRANDKGSMWQATFSVEGGEPVNLIIDNGINEIYLQVLVRLDYDEITPNQTNVLVTAALKALEPYSTVGLAGLAGGIYLRSAFFIDFSNIHAFTNTLQGIALAYAAYLHQLPIAGAERRI